MIASLAMYDRREIASATDAFWALIRNACRLRGIEAPEHLERENPFWQVWESDDMLLSQTCGRPYRKRLHGKVQLVGTPDYGQRDCPAGYYRSAFVVRARDHRGFLSDYAQSTFAYNEILSQSGWAAPQTHAEAQGFRFEKLLETGGHVLSAQAVAEGRADIAALDSLTWDMIKRYEPFSLDLRVQEWTEPSPGLPFITAKSQDAALLGNIVERAIDQLDLNQRRALRLKGLVRIPPADYLSVSNPSDED